MTIVGLSQHRMTDVILTIRFIRPGTGTLTKRVSSFARAKRDRHDATQRLIGCITASCNATLSGVYFAIGVHAMHDLSVASTLQLEVSDSERTFAWMTPRKTVKIA